MSFHIRAADSYFHYSVSYQWSGPHVAGGIGALYFASTDPLSSAAVMERLLRALRGRHEGCAQVVILFIWPLSDGQENKPVVIN